MTGSKGEHMRERMDRIEANHASLKDDVAAARAELAELRRELSEARLPAPAGR